MRRKEKQSVVMSFVGCDGHVCCCVPGLGREELAAADGAVMVLVANQPCAVIQLHFDV